MAVHACRFAASWRVPDEAEFMAQRQMESPMTKSQLDLEITRVSRGAPDGLKMHAVDG